MKFESPAERKAYPILNTLSIEYDLGFIYQEPVGYQSGGYSTKEEWCRVNNYYYDGDERNWNDTSWESEKYRIDFVLTTNFIKLAVEIDGKEFHKNKYKDKAKDDYLKRMGYDVLRIPAKIVEDEYEFKKLILKELEIIK